jgi:hypothetical protein
MPRDSESELADKNEKEEKKSLRYGINAIDYLVEENTLSQNYLYIHFLG